MILFVYVRHWNIIIVLKKAPKGSSDEILDILYKILLSKEVQLRTY